MFHVYCIVILITRKKFSYAILELICIHIDVFNFGILCIYLYFEDVIKEMYIIYYLMEPCYYMKNLYNIAM